MEAKEQQISEELSPPHSNSGVYSWISGIAPLDDEAALSSSVFANNDMDWLFNGLDEPSAKSEANTPKPLKSQDKSIQFSPLPEFLTKLVDSHLHTPTNLMELHSHLESSDSEKMPSESLWVEIEKRIKEVLFDQYEELTTSSPKLTLSAGYAEKFSENQFFEAPTIKRLFYRYFEVFHDHFPILHKPSFVANPAKIAPLLVAAIITLGAFHDSAENYKVAMELHDRLNWLVFSSPDLIPPKLWAIQTLALIQAFEKMASTRHQHEVSATFHSAVITLLRRDGSCANMRPIQQEQRQSIEDEFETWIERESIKRCVLFLFMMDAQHSLLFGHTSFMSVTEIRLELPCSDELWNCPKIEDWLKMMRGTNVGEPSFLDTLISLLGERMLPLHISPFAKLCVLHGLLSVIWHVQQSDPGSLGVNNPSQSIQSRREILEKAIEVWSFSLMSRTASLATEVAKVMHRIGFITLYTPDTSVLDILTFCGSSSLIGRSLRTSDFIRAKASVETWVRSDESSHGFFHSLLLIHQVVFSGTTFEGNSKMYAASTDKLALRPWCLYIATLIVWVYSFFKAKDSCEKLLMPKFNDLHLEQAFNTAEEFVLTSMRFSKLARNENISDSPADELLKSVYLLAVVRDCIKDCRWEMMRDAHKCLGKLIGLDR